MAIRSSVLFLALLGLSFHSVDATAQQQYTPQQMAPNAYSETTTDVPYDDDEESRLNVTFSMSQAGVGTLTINTQTEKPVFDQGRVITFQNAQHVQAMQQHVSQLQQQNEQAQRAMNPGLYDASMALENNQIADPAQRQYWTQRLKAFFAQNQNNPHFNRLINQEENLSQQEAILDFVQREYADFMRNSGGGQNSPQGMVHHAGPQGQWAPQGMTPGPQGQWMHGG